MKLIKYFIALILIVIPASHVAAKTCYSKVEAEADQGIKIHSELMVIGLNCQTIGARHGLDLYGDYRQFTQSHKDLFGKYESILMDFYKKNGMPPKESLNDLRTGYANTISRVSAGTRPDIFCARNAKRIETAKAMDEAAIRRWASTLYDSHPVSYPVCE